jgi:hypothetical protein
MWKLAGLLLALPLFGQTPDPALVQIRQLLLPLRGQRPNLDTRGATPQFDAIKHRLRDWVESRLNAFAPKDDHRTFERKLNDELRRARLFCGTPDATPQDRCNNPEAFEESTGFLHEIALERAFGFLIVRTRLGILCGQDESAYIYRRAADRWQRIWQSEQNSYEAGKYKPQTVHSVLVSLPDKDDRVLVLTLGGHDSCASLLSEVYYRLWSLDPPRPPKPLLDVAARARIDRFPPIVGAIGRNEALIEYVALEPSFYGVTTVRRYLVGSDGSAIRTDPIALGPRDFVREWLSAAWTESTKWSDAAARPKLQNDHRELQGERMLAAMIGAATLHCERRPDLWQVGLPYETPPKYFLVRWRPPYRFTMVQALDAPSPDCTEKDPEADAPRTLFPGQWR